MVAAGSLECRPRDVERFWSKVNKEGPIAEHMETPCWLWTDVPGSHGYGLFWLSPRKVLAHRLSYELSVGPIPENHQLDHRCFVHACVNHGHLRPATNQQNCQNRQHPGRGISWDRRRGKWRAQDHNMGKTTYLGLFVEREEAERVAAAARSRTIGEEIIFERFTDRARRVTVLAQEEARMLNHNYIGTEHFLLGLIHEGEGVAAQALTALGISLTGVRTQVETIIGQGRQPPSGHIPFTPRAKKVMELALREALQLGHNYIGTEHILLGLIREGEGVAAQVLGLLGMDLIRVRQQVIRQLSGPRAKEQPTARIEVLDRMAKEVAKAIASDTETIRGLSENFGKYRWQLDQLKVLATDATGPLGGLSVRSIVVHDAATPPMALVEFSDGSQVLMREDHLRVIGYEAIQTAGKS